MHWTSAITTAFQRKKLFQGTLLALAGGTLMTAAAIFLDQELLSLYGFWIFSIGFLLITAGLLPLRRLQKLSQNPFYLFIENESLVLEKNEKKQLKIPLESIKRFDYCESNAIYGIGIQLKESPEKIAVADCYKKLLRKNRRQATSFGFDLLLPYFTKRSYLELAACARASASSN